MNRARTVGLVGAALRNLLRSGWDGAALGETVEVTTAPLDVLAASGAPGRGGGHLNLLLYRLTPREQEATPALPARDQSGSRDGAAGLSLDLHYLVTAYSTDDFGAEVLLAGAMSTLRSHPVLTRELVNAAQASVEAATSPGGARDTDELPLADLPDALRIVPESLDVMELASLWSAARVPFRLSAGYVVSGLVLGPPTD